MKTGLVLSGGGAKGIAHIGVLKALENLELSPDVIAGCSMGAIIGGIYAGGTSITSIEDFLINKFELKKYTEKWTFQLAGGPILKFIQVEGALSTMIIRKGVDNGDKILKLLNKLTLNKDFSGLKVKFACNAVDLISGREICLDKGNVAEAIRASMSLPGVFYPVKRGSMLLVDGGVLNNSPVWIARKLGAGKVIAIQVSPLTDETEENLKTGISVLLRSMEITAHGLTKERNERANLEIVAYEGAHTMDFHKKLELIDTGERAVITNRDAIYRLFKKRRLFFA
ncbi:MAG: patatin-like phospholipase family protein [Spirochaetes bacterium]|nr:patatin-like phospholipase family protein [Spirochaetota bacterium]